MTTTPIATDQNEVMELASRMSTRPRWRGTKRSQCWRATVTRTVTFSNGPNQPEPTSKTNPPPREKRRVELEKVRTSLHPTNISSSATCVFPPSPSGPREQAATGSLPSRRSRAITNRVFFLQRLTPYKLHTSIHPPCNFLRRLTPNKSIHPHYSDGWSELRVFPPAPAGPKGHSVGERQ